MTCRNCGHTPSCRFDLHGWQCYCKCHDVADAAPDLLEACHLALGRPMIDDDKAAYDYTMQVIRNAIAKAKGGDK